MCCPICPNFPCSKYLDGEECCGKCELFTECFDFVSVEDEEFLGIEG